MKKILISCLAALAAGLLAVGLAACGGEEEEEHLWDPEWKSNAQFHWHNCLNEGCNERDAMLPHEEWALVETIDEPTCNEQGRGVYECVECGYQKEDVIAATGKHHFDESSPWAKDETGHWRICTSCGLAKDMHEHEKLYKVDVKGHEPAARQDGLRDVYCGTCDYWIRREVAPAYRVPTTMKFRVSLIRENTSTGLKYDWAEDDEPLFFTEGAPEGYDAELYIPYNYRDENDVFHRYRVKLEYYDAFNGDGDAIREGELNPNWTGDDASTFNLNFPPQTNFNHIINRPSEDYAVHCLDWELYADADIEDARVEFYVNSDHIAYTFRLHVVSIEEYRQILAEKKGAAASTALPIENIDLDLNASEWKKAVRKA